MYKKIYLVLAVLLFSQCKTSTKKSGVEDFADFVEIDVSLQYPVKELYLQDIAKVEYIPLETNWKTEMKFDARIVYVSDKYIIASESFNGDVYVFDGKGKSKFCFNQKGRTGTKYTHISSIVFDENAKEIFIFDRFATHQKILVYAEDGEFKRTLECFPIFLPQIYNFDNETLLAYDENRYSSKPYLLISKKDGSIVDTLDIHLPIRLSNSFSKEIEIDGQKYTTSLALVTSKNLSYGKNILIADISSDTIYRLTPLKELQPVIVRTPSVHNSEPIIVVASQLATEKYIFLEKVILDFESAITRSFLRFPVTNLIYDFETEELNEYKLLNRDFESLNIDFEPVMASRNTGVYKLNVAGLYAADEAGKIVRGNLRRVLVTLDKWDNPIVVKVTFNK